MKEKEPKFRLVEEEDEDEDEDEEEEENEDEESQAEEEEEDEDEESDDEEAEAKKAVVSKAVPRKKAGRGAAAASASKKKPTKQEMEEAFMEPKERVVRFEPNVVPMLMKNSYFNWYNYGENFSEYVVYNAAQVRVKYVVQLKQNNYGFNF